MIVADGIRSHPLRQDVELTQTPNIPDLTAELQKAKRGDPLDCLKRSLRAAISLEFATIPPYLTALWSIRDAGDVANTFREVVVEEMMHMGLACNMLVALGESPRLATAEFIPSFPGPLPGNVNPSLEIVLRRLTPSQLDVFLQIEFPEGGPISRAAGQLDTIGAFYAALLKAFETLDPPLDPTKQRGESGLSVLNNLTDVRNAINLIRLQGEGSNCAPEESPGHLAHYYQFREIYHGSKFVKNATTGAWGHTGPPVLMPAVWPMADIPQYGYQRADVPDATVWTKIEQFDSMFTLMLRQLQLAWEHPAAPLGDFSAADPVLTMLNLGPIAVELMKKDTPDGLGSYGPCFRMV